MSTGREMFVGVDGCKKGWFAVTLTHGLKWKVQVFGDISSLWHECGRATLILIDVPIGLRDSGPSERQCDKAARELLGRPRSSSVFPVPCRGAAYADASKASDINERLTGRRLSRQALGIMQKIREVDMLLAADNKARCVIKEVHPELCFWALNGRAPMKYGKKEVRGSLERKQLLRTVCSFADDLLGYALKENRGKAGEDDIIDALITALTASIGMRGLSFVPDPPEMDSTGLPMHMAYYALPPRTPGRRVL